MMARKIIELRHAVVHTYNLTQSSYGCNQAEHSFGVINHEQLQPPSNHSSMLQHKPQDDVYNPPWRTHSNGRGVENQNQRPRDFNCNNPSFKNQLKTHPTTTITHTSNTVLRHHSLKMTFINHHN